jgi:hypothetical protein
MKRQSTLNEYTLSVTNQILTIAKGDGELTLNLGEGEKLADLAGVLLKMKGLPAYPPVIRTSPFFVHIEDENLIFGRNNSSGTVATTLGKLDSFVDAVYAIIKIAKDMAVLGNDKAQGAVGNFNDSLNH